MNNLEQETICGYEVSAQMKRVWAMELDMVKRFVEVCEEYNLTYWMMGGTLLGAVRHKGFIPWDNDIDLAMPRHDFKRLLEIGPGAFQRPLFFQSPETEHSRFFSTFVKIRNENGTAASKEEFVTGINCGVFIDIFCLDEIPNSPILRKWYFRSLNEIAKMKRFALGTPLQKGVLNEFKHFLQKAVYYVVFRHPDAAGLFMIYQEMAGIFAGKGCRQIAHRDFGYHDNFIWNKKDWDNVILLDFEGLQLNAPIGYDTILARQYGDYMQFPKDKATHDYFEFSADVPYKQFFK